MATASVPQTSTFGKWMALTAALLGWLFDGFEMGLFPLVARPALLDLGVPDRQFTTWYGVITALFLVGAATGGVVFGWLGDRLGRVRSMMLSVLTYALFSGVSGFATEAWHVGALRFLAALGMGGEWSLGVALINEIWPGRSRAFLAGLIGAAANVGYLFAALLGMVLALYVQGVESFLVSVGLSENAANYLMCPNAEGVKSGWRLLMMLGALPALLTFFIRIFVPESDRWEKERERGATSHWANRDLVAVLIGAGAACGIVVLWAVELPMILRVVGTVAGLGIVIAGYLYPVAQYLRRLGESTNQEVAWGPTLRMMFLAACLSGVALLGTWGSIQQAPSFAHEVMGGAVRTARSDTQFWSSVGAIVGTIAAALVADWLGRRVTYSLLCLGSMIIIPTLFLTATPEAYTLFLFYSVLGGAITASFYGWLPLYLPELFPTKVRATGQGFGFNFGRILAAIGVLQLRNLNEFVQSLGYGWGIAQVCSALSLIYLVGMVLIWFAPETKGKPLPE